VIDGGMRSPRLSLPQPHISYRPHRQLSSSPTPPRNSARKPPVPAPETRASGRRTERLTAADAARPAVTGGCFPWLEPARGIEPRPRPYEGRALPLSYAGIGSLRKVEAGVGFEPTDPCGSSVFGTAAFDHS